MSTNYGQQVYGRGPGTASTTLLDAVRLPRDPTPQDTAYQLGKFWVNSSTNNVWYLVSQSSDGGTLISDWGHITGGSILPGIDTINTIPPDGSGNFTIESLSGTIVITPETNAISIDLVGGGATYEGNTGGLVSPNASNTLFVEGNNLSGINVIGNPGINTLTIVGLQSSTTQQGTVTLATSAQAIAGTDTFNAVTSAALAAKLGTQTAHSLALFEGSTAALIPLGVAANGFLPIGSTGADPVLAALASAGGTITITNGAGSINLDTTGSKVGETITGNTGGALSPTAGNWNIVGNFVTPGFGAPLYTSGSVSTLTLNVQLTGAYGSSSANNAGVASFNSADFTVDSNGYVTLLGTGVLETLSDDVATVVHPTAGNIQLVGHVVEQGATKFSTVVAGSSLLNLNPMSPARWIVDPLGFNGTHTTIGAALTSATSGDTIFLLPGTYTENLTLKAGVNIAANACDGQTPSPTVVINGKCTATFAGTCTLSGVCLQTNGDYALSVTGSSLTYVNLQTCSFSLVSNTAINISSTGEALIQLFNCGNTDAGGNAFFSMSGGQNAIRILDSNIIGSTTATASVMSGTNSIEIRNSRFFYPIDSTSATTTIDIQNSLVVMEGNFVALTVGGTGGNNYLVNSYISSGSASAVSIGAGAEMVVSCCTFNSSNANVLTGAGVLNYGMVVFSGSSSGNNVTTTTPLPTLI